MTDAVASYRRAQVLGGDDADILCNLAAAYEVKGELDEATRFYRAVLNCNPNQARSHNNLGTVLRKRGALDAAVKSYRQALSLRPTYVLAQSNLVAAETELDLQKKALSMREDLSDKPDAADVYINLGSVLKAQRKLDDAESPYRRALSVNPRLISAHCIPKRTTT